MADKIYNLDEWKAFCQTVQNATTVKKTESAQAKQRRINTLLKDYSAFVDYYFPHWCENKQTKKHTPSAKFHIQAANKILSTPNLTAVFQWARGHAKSTHMDVFIPLWLKAQKQRQINVMVLVGKSQDNANSLLADLQAELQYNQRYINDFGKQYSAGSWQEGEFVTLDGCAFFARGRGQSPRGLRYRSSRPDYIVIDDLDDDELSKNKDRVRKMTKWVMTALYGSMDGGRGRFIMVGNLISKNSVLYNLMENDVFFVSKVNAYDKDGNVSWKEKWTKEEVQHEEKVMGYRNFQQEMMNNPITEGAVFKEEWIRWKRPLPLNKYDSIVAYIDPSWKSSKKADYKAVKVWGKYKTELHHLFAFVRQCSLAEMVRWCYDLYEKTYDIASIKFFMETSFMQDMMLQEFTTEGNNRGYQLPIRGDDRKKPDKFQRIEAVSPLWERGFVFYNENMKKDKDMLAGIEQTLAFEKGSSSHDDAPDADESAIFILQKDSRLKNFPYSFTSRQNIIANSSNRF